MAKLQYFDLLGPYADISSFYFEQTMTLDAEASSKKIATFVDDDHHTEIVFKGTQFQYMSGKLQDGTVQSIEFIDGESQPYMTLTNVGVGAAQLVLAMATQRGLDAVFGKIMKGNDTVIGSGLGDTLIFDSGLGNDKINGKGGDDEIGGGKGNDRLTGGEGNDFFVFRKGHGHDVITDFDAIGGEGQQDHILKSFDSIKDIKIEKSGHDVVIDFGGGSTLTLLDVKPSQIKIDDFDMA